MCSEGMLDLLCSRIPTLGNPDGWRKNNGFDFQTDTQKVTHEKCHSLSFNRFLKNKTK